MGGSAGDYLPSPSSVVGAWARALNQLWDLSVEWYEVFAETAWAEDTDLTTRTTTVFIPRGPADVALEVTATRLDLATGGSHPVTGADIVPQAVSAAGTGPNAEIKVTIRDPVVAGTYQLVFRAAATGALVATRIVNFVG